MSSNSELNIWKRERQKSVKDNNPTITTISLEYLIFYLNNLVEDSWLMCIYVIYGKS